MRCPNCSKFVGMENGDPEVNDVEVDNDGGVKVEVRLTRNCAECSTELKDATFNLEGTCEKLVEIFAALTDAEKETAEWEADEAECEVTESGGSRYAKNMIGVTANVTVRLSVEVVEGEKAGERVQKGEESIEMHDEMQASGFDECC